MSDGRDNSDIILTFPWQDSNSQLRRMGRARLPLYHLSWSIINYLNCFYRRWLMSKTQSFSLYVQQFLLELSWQSVHIVALVRLRKRLFCTFCHCECKFKHFSEKKVSMWAEVVAQLTVRSLPIPEDRSSNPVISSFY